MLTRKECIEAAESLAHKNAISRRNAARSLADYCKVILGEIGSHHPGYGVVKDISIKLRFRLLRSVVPELLAYEKLFFDIQELRDKLDHHDAVIPSTDSLKNLIENVKRLDRIFESKIYPNLMKLDTSPQE
jgi:hypothetical protein